MWASGPGRPGGSEEKVFSGVQPVGRTGGRSEPRVELSLCSSDCNCLPNGPRGDESTSPRTQVV